MRKVLGTALAVVLALARIVRVEEYRTKEQALEAVGLAGVERRRP
jgi:hypothetical protein